MFTRSGLTGIANDVVQCDQRLKLLAELPADVLRRRLAVEAAQERRRVPVALDEQLERADLGRQLRRAFRRAPPCAAAIME